VKQQEKSSLRIDSIGLGLLPLGLGALQIALDQGERDDRFGSHFIVMMAVICVASKPPPHRSSPLP
jgi:DHA2 family multidrug resistance protein